MTKPQRVLILGNSHVASVRLGWAQVADQFPQCEMQFFAANSTLFNKLQLTSSHVFGAHKPALYSEKNLKFLDQVFGARTIDLKTFDHVMLVGRSSNEVDFLRQFAGFSIDGLCERPERPRLSQASFAAFASEVARKRLPDQDWHNWDAPKVSFLPSPVPQDNCPDEGRYAEWAQFGADPAVGLDYLKAYRACVAQLYAECGITLLSPPDNVFAPSGLTKAEFGGEPTRLHPRAGVFKGDDYHHMSPEYGAIVLRHVLPMLGLDAAS